MLSSFVFTAALLPFALGHGQVHRFITSNPAAVYVAADAYAAADPTSPIRKLDTTGSAVPFTGPNITCGPGGNVPVPNLATVVAGSKVTFDWSPWGSVHPGPIMTYMAHCPNGCATFKGDTGAVWFKIDHDGYVPSRAIPWAEENIVQYQTYTLTVPASLAAGEYLIRHEILGLHVAFAVDGAQFYPTCVQLKVTGGGSTQPSTGIALPGAYDPNDPSILTQLYWYTPTNSTYVIPGGPVILNGGPGYYGSTAPTSTTSTTTTSKATTTTTTSKSSSATTTSKSSSTTTKATTTTTGSTALATAYAQCGGTGWTGATSCIAGYTCTFGNSFYSQCLPA